MKGSEKNILELKWWPRGKEIPEGWREVENIHQAHHDIHSILIEKVEKP